MRLSTDSLVNPNFQPADIVGLPELAARLGVSVPNRDQSLQPLFKAFGPKAEFTANISRLAEQMGVESGIAPAPVRDEVASSGIMDTIPLRSLLGPELLRHSVNAVLLGGTAFWMELRIAELKEKMEGGLLVAGIHALASEERRCGELEGSPERDHPVVRNLYDASVDSGRPEWPTEAEVMQALLDEHTPSMGLGRIRALPGTGNMEAQAAYFLRSSTSFNPTRGFYVPTNAPAVHIPLQFFVVLKGLFPSVPFGNMWFSQRGRQLAVGADGLRPGKDQNTFASLSVFPRLVAALIALGQTEQS